MSSVGCTAHTRTATASQYHRGCQKIVKLTTVQVRELGPARESYRVDLLCLSSPFTGDVGPFFWHHLSSPLFISIHQRPDRTHSRVGVVLLLARVQEARWKTHQLQWRRFQIKTLRRQMGRRWPVPCVWEAGTGSVEAGAGGGRCVGGRACEVRVMCGSTACEGAWRVLIVIVCKESDRRGVACA